MQIYRHLSVNNVQLKKFDFPRELSMAAYLVENPNVLILDDDELSSVSIIDAEVSISEGRKSKSKDGRIDLLAIYGEATIGVLELKLGELNDQHLSQIEDYLKETPQIRELAGTVTGEKEPNFVGILVGNSITESLAVKIRGGYLVNEQIPIAALLLSRYRGDDNNVYIITDTIFRNVSRKFDRTEYRFNGEVLGKNRLVQSVIKQYAMDNSDVTYAGLEDMFPKYLQGSMGCFTTEKDALDKFAATGYKRFFIDLSEIVALKDSRIAVCTQWGRDNIGSFIDRARDLGYAIEVENS